MLEMDKPIALIADNIIFVAWSIAISTIHRDTVSFEINSHVCKSEHNVFYSIVFKLDFCSWFVQGSYGLL